MKMAAKKSKVDALVLPVGAVPVADAQVFPGMPGVYMPGVAVPLSAIGLDKASAAALVEEMGIPLEPTTMQVEVEDEAPEAEADAPDEEV
jgi:hypothetical protein